MSEHGKKSGGHGGGGGGGFFDNIPVFELPAAAIGETLKAEETLARELGVPEGGGQGGGKHDKAHGKKGDHGHAGGGHAPAKKAH